MFSVPIFAKVSRFSNPIERLRYKQVADLLHFVVRMLSQRFWRRGDIVVYGAGNRATPMLTRS